MSVLGRAVPTGRLRSLGTKVLLALGVTLAVATAVSVIVDARITATGVRAQADVLLTEKLEVVVQSISDDRARRLTAQRFLAGTLRTQGAGNPLPAEDIQGVVAEAQRTIGAAGVQLLSRRGDLLASVGSQPSPADLRQIAEAIDGVPQIVRASDGEPLEVVAVPVNAEVLLVVGEPFGDPLAFALRRLVGDDVVLLHRGEVVGQTTPDIQPIKEALDAGSPDVAPVPLSTSTGNVLLGVADLGPDTAVAIVTPELLQGLTERLAGGRVITFVVLLALAMVLGYLFVRRLTQPLRTLADTADAIRSGDVDRSFTVDRDDEIGALAATLEAMRSTLAQQVDIITEQSQQLRASSARLASARDEERRRLARDLHDGIQQQLVMLRLRVSLLEGGDQQEQKALAGEIDVVIQQLRETSQRIFPSILSDRGLTGGLRSLASSVPISVRLEMSPDPLGRMPAEVETALYFVVAEATTNAVKHAAADRVHIDARADDDIVTVTIRDDGRGFVASPDAWGSGLHHMHDRIIALRGTTDLTSTPGEGTQLQVTVPLGES